MKKVTVVLICEGDEETAEILISDITKSCSDFEGNPIITDSKIEDATEEDLPVREE